MSFRRSPLLHIALIVILGLLAYSSTFDAPFALDDNLIIKNNPLIKNLLNIPAMFAGGIGSFASRPLMHATLAFNYHFGGLDPRGYHVVNLALHLINGILLYLLVVMTGRFLRYADEGATRPVALLASVLFVVHPVQTEAVTYIVSRSMLLATTFYLSGIMLFAKAATAERRKGLYIAGLFIASLLGAASRENFVTFPLMLVLYDLFFISGFKAKEALGRWRLYIAVLPACAYLVHLAINNTYAQDETLIKGIPPIFYALTQLKVHWTFLRLLALPINQNLDYSYPISQALIELPTVLSFVGYLGLWAGAILLARRRSTAAFGMLWFLVALLPISFMLVFVGMALGLRLGDVIFEHRLYLPSAGIIAGFAAVTVSAAREIEFAWARKAVALCLVFALAALSVAAYKRNEVWQSNIRLWTDVIEKSPTNARGYNNRGDAYLGKGFTARAIEDLTKALFIYPDYKMAHINLGVAYAEAGLLQKGIQHFKAAIGIDSRYSKAYNNLGNAYMQIGLMDRAIENFKMALRVDPQNATAFNNLGVAYLRKGLSDVAIEQFTATISLYPEYTAAYYNLGLAYTDKGLIDKAIEYHKMAIRLDPMYARAYAGLGETYMRKGLIGNAIEHYNYYLRLTPNDPIAHEILGAAYLKKGLQDEAQRHFRIADSLRKGGGSPKSESHDVASSPGLQ
jgi:tetratricopeptide (TPR) repeat protein